MSQRSSRKTRFAARGIVRRAMAGAVVVALGGVNAAQAIQIDSGNEAVAINWGNTVRYTYGQRMQGQDPLILSPYGINNDDGDRNFPKNSAVTNRIDLLSEFDLVYQKNHGFRVSATAWGDQAYNKIGGANGGPTNANGIPYYQNALAANGNQTYGLSQASSRFNKGTSGEILDAFVFTNFDVGGAKTNVKLGKHTVYWGEGITLTGALNGISYSQNTLDMAKGLQFPGIEAQELFRPRKALTVQSQVNSEWSVAGQYNFGWEAVHFPEVGGYLGFYDYALRGGQSGLTLPNPATPGANPAVLTRANDILPKQSGDWGLSARWNSEELGGTLGMYARRYTDQLPVNFFQGGRILINGAVAAPAAAQVLGNPLLPASLKPVLAGQLAGGCLVAATCNPALAAVQAQFNAVAAGAAAGTGNYFLGYATDIHMLGLSLSKNVSGVSVGSELSYRQNTPLETMSLYVNSPAFGALTRMPVVAMPGSVDALPIARGNTWHMLVNLLGTVSKTPVFDTATWLAEGNYVRLGKVTQNEAYYKGSASYIDLNTGADPIDKPTKAAWNLTLGFTPTWFQVLPQVDLSLPISWSRGIRGNSAVKGISSEGNGNYSIAFGVKYLEQYLFDLKYVGYMGNLTHQQVAGSLVDTLVANGLTSALRDHGQLLFTFKTTF